MAPSHFAIIGAGAKRFAPTQSFATNTPATDCGERVKRRVARALERRLVPDFIRENPCRVVRYFPTER